MQRTRRLHDWNRIAAATLDVYARLADGRVRRAGDGNGRFALPPSPAEHVHALAEALPRIEGQIERLSALGERLAARLLDGGRLLAVGNGGSAARAQHLTAELVGRYQSERLPLSGICLHGDSSSLTAIANDYGPEAAFARQVLAHGRPGDILVALSTSGRSENVLAAARTARQAGLETWAFTGPVPNPLAVRPSPGVRLPLDGNCAGAAHGRSPRDLRRRDREVALRQAARREGAFA